MSFFSRIFSRRPTRPMEQQRLPPASAEQRHATRRELLLMSAKDTIKRHGIPEQWIAAEALRTAAPGGRDSGMHLRMILKEWQPELLRFLLTFEAAVHDRLLRLDPLSKDWYAGISWRFAVANQAPMPAMPSREYWQRLLPKPVEPESKASSRDLLERLFSSQLQGDESDRHRDFSPTQPMFGAAESSAAPLN